MYILKKVVEMSSLNEYWLSDVSSKYFTYEQLKEHIAQEFKHEIEGLEKNKNSLETETYNRERESLKNRIKVYVHKGPKMNKICKGVALTFFVLAVLAGITLLVTKKIHIDAPGNMPPFDKISLADAYHGLIFNVSLGVVTGGLCVAAFALAVEGKLRESKAKKIQLESHD